MQNIEQHPLGKMYPVMTGPDFLALKNSINSVGLLDPIIMHEGKCLDGWNRLRACMELGIEPATAEFKGENALEFVVGKNARRNLTTGQKAIIAESIANLPPNMNRQGDDSVTLAQAAQMVGVSKATINKFRRVKKDNESVAKKIASGKTSLESAFAVLRQKQAIKKSRKKSGHAAKKEPTINVEDLESGQTDERMIGKMQEFIGLESNVNRALHDIEIVESQAEKLNEEIQADIQEVKRLMKKILSNMIKQNELASDSELI